MAHAIALAEHALWIDSERTSATEIQHSIVTAVAVGTTPFFSDAVVFVQLEAASQDPVVVCRSSF